MTEKHGAPKAGQLPRAWPEVVERQKVVKEQAVQNVRSWTMQNEMLRVLKRIFAGAAERILYSTSPKEIRA